MENTTLWNDENYTINEFQNESIFLISTVEDVEEDIASIEFSDLLISLSLTTIYTIFFIVGLIGNYCTCFVIKGNKTMHTTTNYFIFSLAVVDIFFNSIGPLCGVYELTPSGCNIHLENVNTIFVSTMHVLIIIAFTCHQYLITYHSSVADKKLSMKWFVVIMIILLMIAIGITIDFINPILSSNKVIVLVYVFINYLLPLTFTIIFFTLIIVFLKKSKTECEDRKNVVKIHVAIAVVYFACFIGYYIILLILAFDPILLFKQNISVITHCLKIMECISGCIKPPLYISLATNFRQAFKETLLQISDTKQERKLQTEVCTQRI